MVNGDSISRGLLICASLYSMSGSIVVSCGVKTSVKCLANSAAFSSSVCAHGLGGFVLLRMGGFGIIGFLRDLIDFQSVWSEAFKLEPSV